MVGKIILYFNMIQIPNVDPFPHFVCCLFVYIYLLVLLSFIILLNPFYMCSLFSMGTFVVVHVDFPNIDKMRDIN